METLRLLGEDRAAIEEVRGYEQLTSDS